MPVVHLDEMEVQQVLRWDDLIPAMEKALLAFSTGRALQPVRNVLTIEEGKRYLGIMPAVTDEAMGLKLVSFYPANAAKGIPTHMAMVLLFRPETGEPLAVMDGRLITEMRTAAVSAAVTNRLAAPASRVLALLGSGVQAKAHLQALKCVRRLDEVRVWSRTPEHARRFAEEHGAIATDAYVCCSRCRRRRHSDECARAHPPGRVVETRSTRQRGRLTPADLARTRR